MSILCFLGLHDLPAGPGSISDPVRCARCGKAFWWRHQGVACFFGIHDLPLGPGEIRKNYRAACCGRYFHWDKQSHHFCPGKSPTTFAEIYQKDWQEYQDRLRARFGDDEEGETQ